MKYVTLIIALAATIMIANTIREVSAMPTSTVEKFLPQDQAETQNAEPVEQVALAQE